MFYGEYRHQIDEKGRIRIPSKLKDMLGEHPFITCGANNCLIVLPKAESERIFDERFRSLDPLDPVNGKSVRIMASRGFVADEDKAGRINLPQNLIRHAGIIKNVVTIGAYNRVEIWSEEKWDAYSDIDSEAFDACLSALPPAKEDK